MMEKQEVLRSITTIRTYLEGIQFILEVDPELIENEGGIANFANQLLPCLPEGVGALRINDQLFGLEIATIVWTLDDVNAYLQELMQEIGLYLKEVKDTWL